MLFNIPTNNHLKWHTFQMCVMTSNASGCVTCGSVGNTTSPVSPPNFSPPRDQFCRSFPKIADEKIFFFFFLNKTYYRRYLISKLMHYTYFFTLEKFT